MSSARVELMPMVPTDTAWSIGEGTGHAVGAGDATGAVAGNEPTSNVRCWCLRAEPHFTPASYALAFASLQRFSGAKVLDLSAVRLLDVDVFDALASAWVSDTVPRLAIVLSFERWLMLRESAMAALRPVRARGTEIAVCYAEQAAGAQLATWIARGGEPAHSVPAVIATLVRHWRPLPSWPIVIDTLAELVRRDRSGHDTAELLSELAGLALSYSGSEVGVTLAREALSCMSEAPSATRSKALRRLGSGLLELGQVAAAVDALDAAIAVALACDLPILCALPLYESGLVALDRRDYSGAERRFRAALPLVAEHPSRRLLPLVHRALAIALMRQGSAEARHHAQTALSLHADLGSEHVERDRQLLAQLAAMYDLNVN